VIAAGLDAFQEVRKIGLKVGFVIRRRDAVNARRPILQGDESRLTKPCSVYPNSCIAVQTDPVYVQLRCRSQPQDLPEDAINTVRTGEKRSASLLRCPR
jgi:hypothetical protein